MLSKHLDDATETTIKMAITGATGNNYYVTEVTHGLNMEKFDFGDTALNLSTIMWRPQRKMMGNGKQITQK